MEQNNNPRRQTSITALIIIGALFISAFILPHNDWAYSAHDNLMGTLQNIERGLGY